MNYDQLVDIMAENAWTHYLNAGTKAMPLEHWDSWLRQVLPEELLLEWADHHCARLIKEAFPEWES